MMSLGNQTRLSCILIKTQTAQAAVFYAITFDERPITHFKMLANTMI